MRLERVVHDLTDARRTGNADAPFKLGDQILITYRVNNQKTQNYVALEDLLPAGLETVNPALAMIAKFFDLPADNTEDRTLELSHSELRDRSTLLYFNELFSGSGKYSVLARATAAGTFRWPATQISPMYDSRFSGLSPSRGMRRLRRITIFSAIAATAALWLVWLPLPADLQHSPSGTPVLFDIHGREIAELAGEGARVQIPVSLTQMGDWLPHATVHLEDQRFYVHCGIDWQATCAACLRNLQAGRIVGGGSTITQQLVKIACHRQQRNWIAKAYESVIAWKLERLWTKERILAEYLNRSSFGNRRIGPEAAARAYFGKPASELNLAESIYLAGLPQAPTRFNPWRHPDAAERKYTRSLDLLARTGLLTTAQRTLLSENPPLPGHFDPPHLAPNYVDAIQQRQPRMAGKVRTTLDLDLQRMTELKLRSTSRLIESL